MPECHTVNFWGVTVMLRASVQRLTLAVLLVFFVGTANASDTDLDGVEDSRDNCTEVANPDQLDSDADGYGNRCDGDYDDSGLVDAEDYAKLRVWIGDGSYEPKADHDGNGMVNTIDGIVFLQLHGAPPGPSGLACVGSIPCPAS